MNKAMQLMTFRAVCKSWQTHIERFLHSVCTGEIIAPFRIRFLSTAPFKILFSGAEPEKILRLVDVCHAST